MAAAHRLMVADAVADAIGPERIIADRQNPLETLAASEVFVRFRFSSETVYFLCELLNVRLNYGSARNSPLPVLLQVLVALRFFATGSYQLVVGDLIGVSQPTVSRTCRRVASAISSLSRRFVCFPRGAALATVKRAMKDIAGFPNVIGCIDCSNIRITKPVEDEVDYDNRKGYHSLNVQMICDNRFRIVSLVAKWPGSTHDARVWRDCNLSTEFENGLHNGFLLGDSGYPCKTYLMTPFINPSNRKEERFNGSLCRTRVLIEQSFGIMKRRFPVLHFGIRSTPNVAVNYITSCVVLHNIGIDRGEIIDQMNDANLDVENIDPEDIPIVQGNTGNQIRLQIANQYF